MAKSTQVAHSTHNLTAHATNSVKSFDSIQEGDTFAGNDGTVYALWEIAINHISGDISVTFVLESEQTRVYLSREEFAHALDYSHLTRVEKFEAA